jgi:hypothetical protein
LVAAAYRGTIGSFDQEGYDVLTDSGERLQVKSYTKGRRAGVIRSFGFDVITVELDPSDAAVVSARRYLAGDLFANFRTKWESKYQHINQTSPHGAVPRQIVTTAVGRLSRACRTRTSPSCSCERNAA